MRRDHCRSFPLMISACACLGLLSFTPVQHATHAQDPSIANGSAPPLFKNLTQRTDELCFEKLVERSSVECETFRRSLIEPRQNSISRAQAIAQSCIEFRRIFHQRVAQKPADSYDLSRFILNEQELVDAIEGTREIPDPSDFYGSFEGKWYGLWDGSPVDHHWGRYEKLDQPKTYPINKDASVKLTGYQYAWVGDGYGLNHIASSADGTKNFLLGYVVHVRDQDPQKEFARRPHVGVIDGPDRLIWITPAGVYLEEMIRGTNRENDHYYITGFRYAWAKNETAKLSNSNSESKQKIQIKKTNLDLIGSEAFQVVYSRNANGRQPWQSFEVDLRVETKKLNQQTSH